MNKQDKKDDIIKYEFYIAGVKFHELHTCIGELKEGSAIAMVAESANQYDPNAVQLKFPSPALGKNVMIGYVPAKISAVVRAAMIYSILGCKVIELNKDEKPWKQVRVAIMKEVEGSTNELP